MSAIGPLIGLDEARSRRLRAQADLRAACLVPGAPLPKGLGMADLVATAATWLRRMTCRLGTGLQRQCVRD